MGCGCATCREAGGEREGGLSAQAYPELYPELEGEAGPARRPGRSAPRPRATRCPAKHVFVDCPDPSTPFDTLDNSVSTCRRNRSRPARAADSADCRAHRRIAEHQAARSPHPAWRAHRHARRRQPQLPSEQQARRSRDEGAVPVARRHAPGARGAAGVGIAPCGERQPGTRTPESAASRRGLPVRDAARPATLTAEAGTETRAWTTAEATAATAITRSRTLRAAGIRRPNPKSATSSAAKWATSSIPKPTKTSRNRNICRRSLATKRTASSRTKAVTSSATR